MMQSAKRNSALRAGLGAATALVAMVALSAAPALVRAESHTHKTATGRAPDFEWSGHIAHGGSIEIKDVNGSIDAEPASGDQVEVSAIKSARRSDPDEVKIEVITREDGITICTVYPRSGWGGPNKCEPGRGGRMSTHNNDVEVHYAVRVPAGVRFIGRNVNGGITARLLDGPIEAETVNGSVEVETRGTAEASSVNGSIRAVIGSTSWTDPLEFHTVNGRVRVTLPAGVGAEVHASTVNGSIDTDFPLTVRGRIGSKRLSGTIGKGGGELRLETVNGGIALEAAK